MASKADTGKKNSQAAVKKNRHVVPPSRYLSALLVAGELQADIIDAGGVLGGAAALDDEPFEDRADRISGVLCKSLRVADEFYEDLGAHIAAAIRNVH